MARRSGYTASLDHWALWGTTYDGYLHYSQRLADKYGKANQVTRFADCPLLGAVPLASQRFPASGLFLQQEPVARGAT